MKIIISEQQSRMIHSLMRISVILVENPNKYFKIGKTGISLDKRFNANYKDNYDRIISVIEEEDSLFISHLETILIKYYKQYYPSLCDNENEGEVEATDEKFNCVYMVI